MNLSVFSARGVIVQRISLQSWQFMVQRLRACQSEPKMNISQWNAAISFYFFYVASRAAHHSIGL